MPTKFIADDLWREMIDGSVKYKKEWENLFRCKTLEDYYEGKQWMNVDGAGEKPYTINKVFETVQIKCDSFIPTAPYFTVSPRAGNMDFSIDEAVSSAQLKQDVLNTFVQDEQNMFAEEVRLAYKDSFFRFGIIEVGYAADWIRNPNAQKPILNVDVEDPTGQKPRVLKKYEPEEMPDNERIYFRHVPANTFHVGGFDHRYLHRCDWCGYYEYYSKADLFALPNLINKDKLEDIGYGSNTKTSDQRKLKDRSLDTVKVWHIWHNKLRIRFMIVDDPIIVIFQRSFKRLPFKDYRHDVRISNLSFYPIPPVTHWISPQDELNETREQFRQHRKRFTRKFQARRASILDEEISKFETGGDGTLVITEIENAILPIQNADLGIAADKTMAMSTADLNEISGTTSNDRGIADRTTATESNFVNQRAALRENSERDRVSKWLGRVARETILLAEEKLSVGVWAELNSDSKESLMGEVQANQGAYDFIDADRLRDGFDFRVIVDLSTLSAVSQEMEKKHFIEFISIIAQFPAIAMSPTLVREAAYRCGYRNEKVIKEMQQMALLQQMGTMNGIQQQQGNAAQQNVQGQTPPGLEQAQQLFQQRPS